MRAVWIVPIIVLIAAPCAWSAWEVEYSDGMVEAMARAGHPVPKRVGRFATKQECLAVIEDAVARSGDPSLGWNMWPAPGGYDEPGASSGGEGGTPDPVWGQDGYGIPFYNIIRHARQKATERRMQTARELNEKGNALYSEGDWAQAVQFYKEALKIAPDDPVIQQNIKNAEATEKSYALNRKGVEAMQYLNWEAAARYFREALEASPGHPVILQNLKEAEDIVASEERSRISRQSAMRERGIAETERERREAQQRKQLAARDTAFADLQADAHGFLGKPSGAGGTEANSATGRARVPLPPSFPVSTTPAVDRDSSPILELPPEMYQIIGLIGRNIKEAPQKLGEAVVTALGGGSQLGIIKIAKGLSDEAGRSMQSAVDLIGRGYPEAETADLIRGSESRALRISIDSFSPIPTPLSQEQQQELEVNGRKWFKWLAQPIGGSR